MGDSTATRNVGVDGVAGRGGVAIAQEVIPKKVSRIRQYPQYIFDLKLKKAIEAAKIIDFKSVYYKRARPRVNQMLAKSICPEYNPFANKFTKKWS